MKTLITLAALAASLPLVPAIAGTRTVSQVVRYDASDFATPAARAALDRRIARAAEEVCGTPSSIDLVGQNDLRNCRAAAVAAASAQLARSTAAPAGGIAIAANR